MAEPIKLNTTTNYTSLLQSQWAVDILLLKETGFAFCLKTAVKLSSTVCITCNRKYLLYYAHLNLLALLTLQFLTVIPHSQTMLLQLSNIPMLFQINHASRQGISETVKVHCE